MSDNAVHSFAIIKKLSANDATTLDGHRVTRQEQIYVPEWGTFVKCSPYDDHFIYEDPESHKKLGRWAHMCTCGSPAIIVGFKAYEQDASKYSGGLFVCKHYTDTSITNGYGTHQTGGRKWE
jgi:hypothetical protein